MAFATTKSRIVYVTEETTQGVAVEPSLGSQAIAILSDGFELNGEKELVERNVLTSSISKQIPRTGIKTATGSIGIEWKANGTAGDATECDLLYKSALGSKRTIATTTTTKAGNTTSVLKIEDADISKFALGDVILVKQSGAYHVSPISAIVTTAGSATITLLSPATLAFSDNVVIEKAIVYKGSNSGHPYLTITSYLDNLFKMQSAGHVVASMGLENFSVGQIPTINFGLNGITYDESLEGSYGASTSGATPSEDISGGTDNKFNIALNGQAPVEVTLTLVGKNTGLLIATELQTKINSAVSTGSVTVLFQGGLYVILSNLKGNASSVVITNATSNSIADELKIGVANGGSEIVGVDGNGLTATYDTATPPIALGACVYLDGVAIPVTDLGFSIENTIGRITSTCSPNGIISTRVTERKVAGSFTTYQETDNISYHTRFDTNAVFSLFGYAGIPTANAGEFKDVVAFFIPKCVITAKPIQDADGIATLAISFSSGYSDTFSTDVIVTSI